MEVHSREVHEREGVENERDEEEIDEEESVHMGQAEGDGKRNIAEDVKEKTVEV